MEEKPFEKAPLISEKCLAKDLNKNNSAIKIRKRVLPEMLEIITENWVEISLIRNQEIQ